MTVGGRGEPREGGGGARDDEGEIVLSIVVPVYNQGHSVVANLLAVRERTAASLPGASEVIAVSDGSFDETAAEMLAARSEWLRVIHYDRNLGKGYAVKVGALAARGRWIAYVDADLDIDPAALAGISPPLPSASVSTSRSGRSVTPTSVVHYPAPAG